MIVRWGLDALPAVLAEAGIARPAYLATDRWAGVVGDAPRWSELPWDDAAAIAAFAREADGLVAVGGGSTIDTAKAVSAQSGLPVVSVPTTYSGAEWTPSFGVRDRTRRMRGGGGGARLAGILYEPRLTLGLPRAETVGTALNALAHCAEALYVRGRNDAADRHALAGAELIGRHLPRVVEAPTDVAERTGLLRGAAEAGEALAGAGLGLGHAMAQAVGGRYGFPHGALNAVCLPAALRFNRDVAADALARFAEALETDDPVLRVEELARLGGFERLRDLGVPLDDLRELAEATVSRAGARANPRPASPDDVEALLASIW